MSQNVEKRLRNLEQKYGKKSEYILLNPTPEEIHEAEKSGKKVISIHMEGLRKNKN